MNERTRRKRAILRERRWENSKHWFSSGPVSFNIVTGYDLYLQALYNPYTSTGLRR